MTKEILPCVPLTTPREKIDGNVNSTRVYRHTSWPIQSGRAVIWEDLFSVASEVEFPETTNNSLSLSQMLQYPLLTLVFVRRFPTSCFVNDFAVESLPRLFSTFEAPCFAVFPVGLKNDRISCRKICNYNWNTGYKTITGNENDSQTILV